MSAAMASIGPNDLEETTKRPCRTCTQNAPTYADYQEFLFSDDEGSVSDEELCVEDLGGSDEDEDYDASKGEEIYDKKLGNPDWVGRRICKVFGSQGTFEGIVFGSDDDAQRNGYRLFRVHYFEDPDDGESMWVKELIQ